MGIAATLHCALSIETKQPITEGPQPVQYPIFSLREKYRSTARYSQDTWAWGLATYLHACKSLRAIQMIVHWLLQSEHGAKRQKSPLKKKKKPSEQQRTQKESRSNPKMYIELRVSGRKLEKGAQGEWEQEGEPRKRGKPTAAKQVSPLV